MNRSRCFRELCGLPPSQNDDLCLKSGEEHDWRLVNASAMGIKGQLLVRVAKIEMLYNISSLDPLHCLRFSLFQFCFTFFIFAKSFCFVTMLCSLVNFLINSFYCSACFNQCYTFYFFRDALPVDKKGESKGSQLKTLCWGTKSACSQVF